MSEKKYAKYVKAFVDKMKEVDPTIKIIVDANSAALFRIIKGTAIEQGRSQEYKVAIAE